jgi:hypothetical protein
MAPIDHSSRRIASRVRRQGGLAFAGAGRPVVMFRNIFGKSSRLKPLAW